MKKRGFCKFYKNLYWGTSVKNHSLVKWRLTYGSGQFNIFCIIKSMNDSDQLEIIHCAFLKQQIFRKYPAFVYGIAGSYDEALDIVIRISDKAIAAGMEGRILEFLDRG